jgi:hypothetical protein
MAANLLFLADLFTPMTRLSKAAAWTAAAAVPALLVYWLPAGYAIPLAVICLIALFAIGWAFVFRDDSHERLLRDAELDALFDKVFSDYEADLSRFPFRAHIFRRSGMFPVEKLQMIYSYRTHATDPDRDIRFYRYFGRSGEGLVWQTCENSDVRFFRRDDVADTKAAFHLRGSQDSATREVFAVLTLPLRQVVGGNQSTSANGPIGVLSFDALSTEAADSLQDLFNTFHQGEHPELAELADRASLYV